MAKEFNTDLIGKIPIDPSIRVEEDQGISQSFDYFQPIVKNLLKKLNYS